MFGWYLLKAGNLLYTVQFFRLSTSTVDLKRVVKNKKWRMAHNCEKHKKFYVLTIFFNSSLAKLVFQIKNIRVKVLCTLKIFKKVFSAFKRRFIIFSWTILPRHHRTVYMNLTEWIEKFNKVNWWLLKMRFRIHIKISCWKINRKLYIVN